MTNEEFADLIPARTTNLRDHFENKLSAMQANIYGKLLSMGSNMLDLRADILRLRDSVNAQAKALDERR